MANLTSAAIAFLFPVILKFDMEQNPLPVIFEIGDIKSVAQQFLNWVKPFKVWAFRGELGAGKTTFITALCREMGVKDPVTSPTFSIIQEYRAGENTIYHIDLYRIKDEEEARNAGIEDCLDSGSYCMVEWPENAPGLFLEETVYTDLEVENRQKRKLVITLPV